MKLHLKILQIDLALLVGFHLYSQDQRIERVEREAYSTIQSQLQRADANHDGRLLSDGQALAKKLGSVFPNGHIVDKGQFERRADWKRFAIRTRVNQAWLIQIEIAQGVDAAARSMALYFAMVQAAFRPGTKSGVLVGQARYFYGCDSLVFLRRNAIVWVSPDLSGRRGPSTSCEKMSGECEGLALTVDREIQKMFPIPMSR